MKIDSWQNDRDDRRADPRSVTRVDAHLEHPDGTLSGLVVDISFGGAKFVTKTLEPMLALGCRVVLTVEPQAAAAAEEMRWAGEVVRSESSGDDGPPRVAYGLAFDDSAMRPHTSFDELGLTDTD